jgi:hypothetical protein
VTRPKAPKREGPGRPSKLTPAVRDRLLQALRAGNFRKPAAFYAGIGMRTLQEWMRAGLEQPAGAFGEFRASVLEAERGAEIVMVANIASAAKKDWKAAAWWLERKANERWGRPERKEPAGHGEGTRVSFVFNRGAK